MKTWYTIKAQGEDSAEIDIFDEIGFWGISAKHFINNLRGVGPVKNIRVRINSIGGEIFDGIAIYNALKRHQAAVTVEVYGIAASVASIIAMAGDKVIMPENTYLFVHDPLALVVGDADDMREMADALDKIASGLVATYVSKTGKSEKEVKKWMAEDTWFTAAEAKDVGLADEVTIAVKLAARADLSRFTNLPAALKEFPGSATDSSIENPKSKIENEEAIRADARREIEEQTRGILDACTKAGIPEAASDFLARGMSLKDVRAHLNDADKIRAACSAARLPGGEAAAAARASGYIKSGLTIQEVRADLFDIKSKLDPGEIDNKLVPAAQTRKPAAVVIDYQDIYARRRNWSQRQNRS